MATTPQQERPAATRFACLAPAARAVFLAGMFNGCPKCVPNSFGSMNRLIEVT